MQWTRTITSGRRSTSSTTGRPVASAHSTADSSMPSSVNRRPSGCENTPMRWKALMALGEANSTRPSPSTTTNPSPTRGVSSVPTSWSGKGKADSPTIWASRSKTSR